MKTKRTVWKQGGSLAITLPANFAATNNIKEGDAVSIVTEQVLKIIPMTECKGKQSVVVHKLDK